MKHVVPPAPDTNATPCSKCGQPHERAGQRYCADCHATYMREWRRTHSLNDEAKMRDNARSYAGTYKRRGKLDPEPCMCCGSPDAEMHHPDHERPLVVVWMCRACHLSWHAFWRDVVLVAWQFWSARAKRDLRSDAA